MLKHGRLKPANRPVRWSAYLTLVAVVSALPLSGLRGESPQVPHEEVEALSADSIDESTAESKMKRDMAAKEEANKLYPPVILSGTLIYRSNRFQNDSVGPWITWGSHVYEVIMTGETMSDDFVLQTINQMKFRWDSKERSRSAMIFKNPTQVAKNSIPGVTTSLLNSRLTGLISNGQAQKIDGHQVKHYGSRLIAGKLDQSVKTNTWVVDDSSGFYMATSEAEIIKLISEKRVDDGFVPASLLADYDAAAAAVIYSDCTDWQERFLPYFTGSQKVIDYPETMTWVSTLNGLVEAGAFLIPGDQATAKVKAVYRDQDAAFTAKVKFDSFLSDLQQGSAENLKTNETTIPTPVSSSNWYDSLVIDQQDNIVTMSFVVEPYFESWIRPGLTVDYSELPGWFALLGSEIERQSDSSTIQITHPSSFEPPANLLQTINAKQLRGHRIRLQCEMENDRLAGSQAGLVLFTNDQNDQLMNHHSIASDGVTELTAETFRQARDAQPSDQRQWKTVSVEIDVPENASTLTFGCLVKGASIKIRQLEFQDQGRSPDMSLASKVDPGFLELYCIPERTVHSHPVNLSFSEMEELSEAPEQRIAEGPEESIDR